MLTSKMTVLLLFLRVFEFIMCLVALYYVIKFINKYLK